MALKASTQATSAASSRLLSSIAAEFPRRAHIHHQHDRQLALLGEFLHERIPVHLAEPRRHVPVDRAHLVARRVFAHLLEVHPAALEDAPVLPRKRRRDQPARLQFDVRIFSGCRLESACACIVTYGTGRPAKMRSMIVSLVTLSASAS